MAPGQGRWDASTPLGPTLVSTDEAPDPAALTLRTLVNGEVVQEATTDLMIFPVPTLISVISEFATLQPGDVILTGTPAGVGFRREPPLLMADGAIRRGRDRRDRSHREPVRLGAGAVTRAPARGYSFLPAR